MVLTIVGVRLADCMGDLVGDCIIVEVVPGLVRHHVDVEAEGVGLEPLASHTCCRAFQVEASRDWGDGHVPEGSGLREELFHSCVYHVDTSTEHDCFLSWCEDIIRPFRAGVNR